MKKRILVVLIMLLVLMMLCACEGKTETSSVSSEITATTSATETVATEVGKGNTTFTFSYKTVDGTEKQYTVHTDKSMVGEALLEVNLIAGEDSEYGLYVKTVDGNTLDYDKDGKYWAFYVNGSYGTSGVDTTPINPGDTYEFRAE